MKKKKLIFTLASISISLIVALVCVEIVFRIYEINEHGTTLNYEKVLKRPVKIDPKLGLIFKPNATSEHSDGIDYYCKSKTNRYGFLDRDFELEKPKDTYRILFIGDSYLEASQLPHQDKVHVQCEKIINQKRKYKNVQTMALSFSGMGTINQLAYYEHLGRKFKPDLVVLVFIANDFANNSPALHAINEGWRPDKSPRLFYELDHRKSNKILEFPIQKKMITSNYLGIDVPDKYRIKSRRGPAPPSLIDKTFAWSQFYPYFKNSMATYFEKEDKDTLANHLFKFRLQTLRKSKFYKPKLVGWNYPDDLGMVRMFACKEMPRIFNEAMRLTTIGLQTFKETTHKDGADFIIVGGHFLTEVDTDNTFGRKVIKGEMFNKLQRITNYLEVDLINLYDEFKKRGPLKDTMWTHDSHWNQTGHRWAAEAIAEYIDEKEKIPFRRSFLFR